MSSNFNNAKVINVYYNKGDRKPYDVNGKPIAYIGEEFVGANEATEIRFHFGEELDSASAIIVAKRANGDTRLDPLTLVGTGVNSYFKISLNAWYAEYKGKMTIIFKAYNGTVTYDDPVTPTQIVSTTGQIIVSDIFNLDVGYAPNASSLVPPFETEDYDDWFFTLSTKLDKAQSITVVGALPTLTGGVYDDRYFYVENEGTGRLYYINGSTAIEVVWGIGQLNFATTGVPSATLTAGQMRYNDTTGSLDLGLKGDHVLKMGEVLVKRVRNADASSLKVGQLVYVFGAVGSSGLLEVKKASNLGESTSSKTFGMVATAMNTTSSKDGYVYLYGLLQGVNLNDTDVAEGSFSSGDVGSQLWLGESGKITKTLPTADTKHSVFVGYLDSYQGSGSNCGIYTKIQNGYELNELHNVRISSVADNQILRYNSTRGVWENTSELTTAETDINNIESGTTIVGKANADKDGNEFDATYLKKASASSTYVPLSSKGQANGVVPLNSDGKISSVYLSGEQDDYVEYANLAGFPAVGEADIIYCAIDTGLIYRWTGSTYAIISPSLALGTTATTAFAGDRGLATETKTNNIVSGVQGLTDTRITNSAVGVVPLIVNGVASTSAFLQEWQVGSSSKAHISSTGTIRSAVGISNLSSENNSVLYTLTTGTTILRNIADTNPALIVNKNLGTGNILKLQSAGADKLEVDVNGWLYQNGTRLFTQIGNATNTFLGVSSGGFSTTGVQNTAVGANALLSITSAGNNASLGVNAGRTLTTGSGNTFLGFEAGFNASQLVSASNSTALGNGSYTDASNQMVFGNASVTQFKFDRNASAVLVAPNLGVGTANALRKVSILTSENSDGIQIRRNSATTNDYATLGFRINTTELANNFAEIRAIRTNRVQATDTDIAFITLTNGSLNERLRIRDDGNVGIGTTAPAQKLEVEGNININGNNAISSLNGYYHRLSFANYAYNIVQTGGSDYATGTQGLVINENHGNTGSNYGISLGTNNVSRLFINTSGLVGIGETTPTAQLQVKSGATNRVALIVDSLTGQTANLQEWKLNGTINAVVSSDGRFYTRAGISNYLSNNNSKIDLTDNGTEIRRNVADSNPALIVNLAHASATGNIQVWQKAGDAKLAINGSGTLRNATLENNSTLALTTAGTRIERNITGGLNYVLAVKQIHASSTAPIQIWEDSVGEVAKVEIDGDFYNTNGTYGTISDLRLKENIVEARDYTEDLMKLRVVKYSLKKNKDEKPTHLGFIAQEVEQVFPNMVHTQETDEIADLKSIKMSVLIPMLVKTIQELNERIKELEKK